jgi:hypothetical protein
MYFSGKEPRKALKASECPIGVEANEKHFVAPVISLQPLLIVDLALARINVLYSKLAPRFRRALHWYCVPTA